MYYFFVLFLVNSIFFYFKQSNIHNQTKCFSALLLNSVEYFEHRPIKNAFFTKFAKIWDKKMTAEQRIIRSWRFWRQGNHTVRCKSRCSFWLHRWHRIRNFCLQNSANLHCIYDWVNLWDELPFTEWCAFFQVLILLFAKDFYQLRLSGLPNQILQNGSQWLFFLTFNKDRK